MAKQKWEAPQAGPEGDNEAYLRMSEAEKDLSKKYEIAAERMGQMKITGNIDLTWGRQPHEPPVLEGVINGMHIKIEGSASAPRIDVIQLPTARPAKEYSGTIDGVEMSHEDARYLFGKLMGIAITTNEKEYAREGVADERVAHLLRKIRLAPGPDEYPYPGEKPPEYK